MTKTNEIILSNERLVKLGDQLNEVLHEIEMQNHVINFVPNPSIVGENALFYYNSVHQALETFYETNQKTMETLDRVSFILQNFTDKAELKAVGEHIAENE